MNNVCKDAYCAITNEVIIIKSIFNYQIFGAVLSTTISTRQLYVGPMCGCYDVICRLNIMHIKNMSS